MAEIMFIPDGPWEFTGVEMDSLKVSFRSDVLSRIDELAERMAVTRQDVIRYLVSVGLRAWDETIASHRPKPRPTTEGESHER